MTTSSTHNAIVSVLKRMPAVDFADSSRELLAVLGYRSERTLDGQTGNVADFIEQFPAPHPGTASENNFAQQATFAALIFQVTSDEIEIIAQGQQMLFDADGFDQGLAQSFLFMAIELKGTRYPRSQYISFTREINKRFPAPAVVLFKTADNLLTLAFVHRRMNQRDPKRDVLGSVSLVREIDPTNPHRAHLDILQDLSLEKRLRWMNANGKPYNFDGLLAAWLDALDTEELNRQFYRDLFAWFSRATREATFPTKEAKTLPPEEHIIRLITRLLFVWFIKEKGLIAEELFIEANVKALLHDYDPVNGDSYYRAILQNLFFATLNTEIHRRGFSKASNTTHRDPSRYRYANEIADPDNLLQLFAQTPFINGGLFDCLDSYEASNQGGYRIDCFSDNPNQRKDYSIPNRLFFDDNGLLPLFNRYKFTVEENTPTEQEVALDPELLGKVFENLLAAYNPETSSTARKQTGSYYTPRPVVDFMVDEALTAAIATRCQPMDGDMDFWQARLRGILDYADAFDDADELFEERERLGIVRAIAHLTVIDPAVGSGAFPMGVLHKLTLALRRLDPQNIRWEELQKEIAGQRALSAFDTQDQQERDAELTNISATFERYRESDFGRKLYLIQNSIFGVDIQTIATQIAKLRFFISLAIEQEPDPDADNYGIKPLPNLETRFVAANTLLGLGNLQMSLAQTDSLQQELNTNRERHFHATARQQKLACRKKDKELRDKLAAKLQWAGMSDDDAEKIAHWDPYDQNASADWFDPAYMFGVKEGFDVIIGNPPYVKVEHLSHDIRTQLKESFGWLGDLYEHFISQGLAFVSDNGTFSYIANDSYVTFSTKVKSRELILQNQLLHLVRAPAQTFEASIYAAIFVLSKKQPSASHIYVSGEMNAARGFQYQPLGKVPYEIVHRLPNKQFLLAGENHLLMRLLEFESIKNVCRILDTGIDSGNVRRKIFFAENAQNRERLLQGRQIQRYGLYWNSPKAKYKFCDIHYQPLPIPGIGRGGRPSSRNEYWKFRGDIQNHHQPERLLMRQTDDDLVVAYHSEKESGRFYTDNTLFTILPNSFGQTVNLKYLLALLNSRLLNFVYHSISQEKGKSQAQVKIKNVNELPVVIPKEEKQKPMIELVNNILAAKDADPSADTSELEAEIDRLCYHLYGLTDEEIAVVEGVTT